MKYFKRERLYSQNQLTNRARKARKRSLKLGVKGFFTRFTIENLYVKQRGKCATCEIYLQGKFEVDHIFPLSKGGSNDRENIQLLCVKCNRKKSNGTFEKAN